MRFTRRSVNTGLAAGLATSAFSPIARAGGDAIKIGMVVSVTGPGADSGKYALTGAKIALDRVYKSGGALGKPVELVPEDDQTTNPGAVLAFSKLRRAAGHSRVHRPNSVDADARNGARYPEGE
jgi:branched-chain amino acid transport system substrate-binding protein